MENESLPVIIKKKSNGDSTMKDHHTNADTSSSSARHSSSSSVAIIRELKMANAQLTTKLEMKDKIYMDHLDNIMKELEKLRSHKKHSTKLLKDKDAQLSKLQVQSASQKHELNNLRQCIILQEEGQKQQHHSRRRLGSSSGSQGISCGSSGGCSLVLLACAYGDGYGRGSGSLLCYQQLLLQLRQSVSKKEPRLQLVVKRLNQLRKS